jgi:hypothetical protein
VEAPPAARSQPLASPHFSRVPFIALDLVVVPTPGLALLDSTKRHYARSAYILAHLNMIKAPVRSEKRGGLLKRLLIAWPGRALRGKRSQAFFSISMPIIVDCRQFQPMQSDAYVSWLCIWRHISMGSAISPLLNNISCCRALSLKWPRPAIY